MVTVIGKLSTSGIGLQNKNWILGATKRGSFEERKKKNLTPRQPKRG
jgi:hypothetical protein